jgi:ribonuclease P protein component
MLSQRSRISNQRLIDKLNKEGNTYKTAHFVFKFLPSISADSKFATIVSKKISLKAVVRNKLRRRISESVRKNLHNIKKPMVCLVVQKKGSSESLDYATIDAEVKEFINHHSDDV